VDAGIVTENELRGWRTISVGLVGWPHSPPAHGRVQSLIGGLSDFAAKSVLRPLTRALLTHLEFVTIHPFLDGNGRLGRLLGQELASPRLTSEVFRFFFLNRGKKKRIPAVGDNVTI